MYNKDLLIVAKGMGKELAEICRCKVIYHPHKNLNDSETFYPSVEELRKWLVVRGYLYILNSVIEYEDFNSKLYVIYPITTLKETLLSVILKVVGYDLEELLNSEC